MVERKTAAAVCLAISGLVIAVTSEAQIGGSPPPTPLPPVLQIDGTVTSTIAVPDGGIRVTLATDEVGVNIISATRLDTNITNTYVPVAGDAAGTRLAIEVANTPSVTVSGTPSVTIIGTPTFALPDSTLSLLAGQRNCSYTPLGNPRIDAGSPTPMPRAASQTGITLQAHNFGNQVDFVSCWPETFDAGPLPSCAPGGIGYAIHAGGAVDLDLTSAQRVHCIACAHGGGPGAQSADIAGGVTSCIP